MVWNSILGYIVKSLSRFSKFNYLHVSNFEYSSNATKAMLILSRLKSPYNSTHYYLLQKKSVKKRKVFYNLISIGCYLLAATHL